VRAIFAAKFVAIAGRHTTSVPRSARVSQARSIAINTALYRIVRTIFAAKFIAIAGRHTTSVPSQGVLFVKGVRAVSVSQARNMRTAFAPKLITIASGHTTSLPPQGVRFVIVDIVVPSLVFVGKLSSKDECSTAQLGLMLAIGAVFIPVRW
jgi:hypothetical protein